MDWRESVNCQNCVTLNKKLELFQLLKQQCSKNDDVAKNLLLMKKYCEKSAKILETKTRKLTEIRSELTENRSKLRDVQQSEEVLRRKYTEYQLRLVTADTKYQDVLKDLEKEQNNYAFLLKEKQLLDDLIEQKDNDIACHIITSRQSAEQYKVDTEKLKTSIENLEETVQRWKTRNQNLTKIKNSFQKKYKKMSTTLLQIFKDDGFIVSGESLSQLKRLITRLKSQANAAKLEAELNIPSMTPDGAASSDTGIFSGDEDIGSPSLDDDLQMSSDSSDDEFENVQSTALNKMTFSYEVGKCETLEHSCNPVESSISQMSATASKSKPLSECLPSFDLNSSNDSFDDADNTLTPSLTDSISDNIESNFRSPVGSPSRTSPLVSSNHALNSESNLRSPVGSPSRTSPVVSSNHALNSESNLRSPVGSPSRTSPTLSSNHALESDCGETSNSFTIKSKFCAVRGGSIFDIPSPDSTDSHSPYKFISKPDVTFKGVSACAQSKREWGLESPPKKSLEMNPLEADDDLMDVSAPSKRFQNLASPSMKSPVKIIANDDAHLEPEENLPKVWDQTGSSLASSSEKSPVKDTSKLIADADENLSDLSAQNECQGDFTSLIKLSVKDTSIKEPFCNSEVNMDRKEEQQSLTSPVSALPFPVFEETRELPVSTPSAKMDSSLGSVDDMCGLLSSCIKSDNEGAISNYSNDTTCSDLENEVVTDIYDSNRLEADSDLESDDEDLDSMLKEWVPPTPVMPFSEDSSSSEGRISSNEPGDKLPSTSVVAAINPFADLQKSSLYSIGSKTGAQHTPETQQRSAIYKISVGTNTDSVDFPVPSPLTCPAAKSPPLKISVGTITESCGLTSVSENLPKVSSNSSSNVIQCSFEKHDEEVSTILQDKAVSPIKISYADTGVMPIEEFRKNASVSPLKKSSAEIGTSPVKGLFRSISVSPIQAKKIDRETGPAELEIEVETLSNNTSSVDKAVSPVKISCVDVGVMPIEEFWKNTSVSPMRSMNANAATSPVKCFFKDVSVSPFKGKRTDRETSPVEFETSTLSMHMETIDGGNQEMCELNSSPYLRSKSPLGRRNYVPGCYKEAKMLQKAVEVLGINPEYLEAVVLDKTIVDEVRQVMEMALKKASQFGISSKEGTPTIQTPRTPVFCSFDPCEFAEICNQQHYNLHLLAKSKNLEETMCSFGKTKKQKIKRLKGHSRRRRTNKRLSLSFKEELIEEDSSRVAGIILESTSCDDTTVAEESSQTIEDIPSTLRTEATSKELPETAESSPEIECREMTGVDLTTDISPVNNRSLGSSRLCSRTRIISNEEPDVGQTSNQVDKSNDKFNTLTIGEKSTLVNDKQSILEKKRMDSDAVSLSVVVSADNQLSAEPSEESNMETACGSSEHLGHDQVINDTGFDYRSESMVIEDLHESAEKNSEADLNSLDLESPSRKAKPGKRIMCKRQSTSSESSNADSTTSENNKVMPVRRSPRTKKVRVAHNWDSGSKATYPRGYIKFVRGESVFVSTEPEQEDDQKQMKHCFVGPSETNASFHNLHAADKLVTSNADVCLEKVSTTPSRYLNIQEQRDFVLGRAVSKRGAPNEPEDESISKRHKLSSPKELFEERNKNHNNTLISREIRENKREKSNIGLEQGENQPSKERKGRNSTESSIQAMQSRCAPRKLSKLQKMRSSVSKVHPLAQASKVVKSFEEKEVINNPVDSSHLKIPPASPSQKSNSTLPSQNEVDRERLKSQAEIIKKLRGRECVRMAAAASGRVAQLVEVKPIDSRRQRLAVSRPISDMPTKFVSKAARLQPLMRPEDRISAVSSNRGMLRQSSVPHGAPNVLEISPQRTQTPPIVKSEVQICEASSTANSDQTSTPQITSEHVIKSSSDTVIAQLPVVASFLIPNDSNKTVTTVNPLVHSICEHSSRNPNCAIKDLKCTEQLVQGTLRQFIAAPSFTPEVLEKAMNVLSSSDSDRVLPIIVRDIVKMMDDDYDTPLASFGKMRTNAPPLTPVQQQLLTLMIQLSRQHQHFEQLPHQVLRLLEYRVFRLGKTPEDLRLMWCTRLYTAVCRALCLRTQALIFCWDALYTLRSKSYHIIRTVLDVWPYLFPMHPSFEKACPNAQVMVHLLRSHVEDPTKGQHQKKIDKGWLKLILNSPALRVTSINSSILATKIFSDLLGGGSDVNVAALVLLAKREEEHWALKNVVTGKLLPALERWRSKCLDDVAGERVIWTMCSILRALAPERIGTTALTVLGLLKSELSQKESKSISSHMQEVIAIGMVLLSRHDIESVAVALRSWNPDHGPSAGYSPRLLHYLSSMIESGSRSITWWKRFLKVLTETNLDKRLLGTNSKIDLYQ